MEFIWYIFIFLISLIFCLRDDSFRNKRYFYLFWIFIVILHSIIVRSSGFDSDIASYARFAVGENQMGEPMPIEFGFGTWYPKFNQEPILFIFLKYIYILTNDLVTTFILIDLIIFYFLFLGLRYLEIFIQENMDYKKKVNLSYLYFQILIFFPQVFSMQALLRQYLASVFLLVALSALLINKKRGYLFFLLGILSHNSALIFLPLTSIFNNSSIRIFLMIFAMIISPILFNYFLSFYYQQPIGQIIGYAYLAIQGILLFFVYFLYSMRPYKVSGKFLIIFTYIFYLILVAAFMSESNIVERLALFSLFLTYPLIIVLVEKTFSSGRILIRLTLTTAGFIGTILLFPGVIGLV